MSEWITDRRPTEDDGPMVYGPDGKVCHLSYIFTGEAWKPIPKCEPYVKPKRWEAVYDRYYKCWAIGDRAHVTQLARLALYSVCRCHLDDRADVTHLVHLVENNDEHREAAERIAAIYEELLP